MAYNDDITWADIVGDLAYYGLRDKDAIIAGHEQYLEWVSFRAGRDDATLATALSVSTTAISDAEYAFSAMEDIYLMATGNSVGVANRFDAIRKFT